MNVCPYCVTLSTLLDVSAESDVLHPKNCAVIIDFGLVKPLQCEQQHFHAGHGLQQRQPQTTEGFWQFGVQHGGNYEQLARELHTYRDGSIVHIVYKVSTRPDGALQL